MKKESEVNVYILFKGSYYFLVLLIVDYVGKSGGSVVLLEVLIF